MTSIDFSYWVDETSAYLVTTDGYFLVFGDPGAATAWALTSPQAVLSLFSPQRKQYTSTFSLTLTAPENWVDSAADQMVDSDGDTLVFNDVVSGSANPISLTAPLSDSALDSQER